MVPLTNTTKGIDVFQAIKRLIEKFDITTSKIISVATDGAPAMRGRRNGFLGLFQDYIGHEILFVHCIIHQQVLSTKSNSVSEVISVIWEIIKKIKNKSSLTNRLFKEYLQEENITDHLPDYCHVRWLSANKMVQSYLVLEEHILKFIKDKELVPKEKLSGLESFDWKLRVRFISDILQLFAKLNQSLQGRNTILLQSMNEIFKCVEKLKMMQRDLGEGELKFFPILLKFTSDKENYIIEQEPLSTMYSNFQNVIDQLISRNNFRIWFVFEGHPRRIEHNET
ncbi:hypothetical protein SNEBB_006546 [Seison nebaliae]|nr:hypothetical protein SNEBB_006546 [Seison nebaliae]